MSLCLTAQKSITVHNGNAHPFVSLLHSSDHIWYWDFTLFMLTEILIASVWCLLNTRWNSVGSRIFFMHSKKNKFGCTLIYMWQFGYKWMQIDFQDYWNNIYNSFIVKTESLGSLFLKNVVSCMPRECYNILFWFLLSCTVLCFCVPDI